MDEEAAAAVGIMLLTDFIAKLMSLSLIRCVMRNFQVTYIRCLSLELKQIGYYITQNITNYRKQNYFHKLYEQQYMNDFSLRSLQTLL